jgi:hypothetical protein
MSLGALTLVGQNLSSMSYLFPPVNYKWSMVILLSIVKMPLDRDDFADDLTSL